MSQGRNQTSRVDIQEKLWLAIYVDFHILVVKAFELQRDPDAVYEWAEATAVELQVTV